MAGHSAALAVDRTQHLGSKGDYVQGCENSARQVIARGVVGKGTSMEEDCGREGEGWMVRRCSVGGESRRAGRWDVV